MWEDVNTQRHNHEVVCKEEYATRVLPLLAGKSHHSAVWVTVYLSLQFLTQSCSYLWGKGGRQAEEGKANAEVTGS